MPPSDLNEAVQSDAFGHVWVSERLQLSWVGGVHGTTPICRLPAHVVVLGASCVRHGVGEIRRPAVALPSGVSHRVEVRGQTKLIAYLDARRYAFADAEDLATRWSGADPACVQPLDLFEDAQRRPLRPMQPRLERALDALREGATVDQAAARARISTTHLAHLLTEKTGAPPRMWRRWLRMQRAVGAIASGQTATEAAYSAGFADGAHLTRTSRATLGVTPSGLRRTGWSFVADARW